MINQIEQIGLQGVTNGLKSAEKSAVQIASGIAPEGSDALVSSIVDLKGAERQISASAKVIKVADELTESVLNILA